MPLTKVKTGNMYQNKDFVTHTHTHLRGACPHACTYCYVQHGAGARFGHYAGPLHLEDEEFDVKYGKGKKIFIEHCADLFADAVSDEWICLILEHCRSWPENEYIFQTKNPRRFDRFAHKTPDQFLIGTTIESDKWFPQMGNAPHPWMRGVIGLDFVTIEPIMKFTSLFTSALINMKPKFINIGADSKRCGLVEPEPDDIRKLIAELRTAGIEVRLKPNLARLLPEIKP